MKEKKLEPLIKTTTLRDKEVNIKDTMNFDRRTGFQIEKEKKEQQAEEETKVSEKKQPKTVIASVEKKESIIEHRKKTMKTQKVSMDVSLKLEIIDAFLRSAENINHDGKISVNDKIDILIDSYIHSKLSTRQIEGFKAIYDSYSTED